MNKTIVRCVAGLLIGCSYVSYANEGLDHVKTEPSEILETTDPSSSLTIIENLYSRDESVSSHGGLNILEYEHFSQTPGAVTVTEWSPNGTDESFDNQLAREWISECIYTINTTTNSSALALEDDKMDDVDGDVAHEAYPSALTQHLLKIRDELLNDLTLYDYETNAAVQACVTAYVKDHSVDMSPSSSVSSSPCWGTINPCRTSDTQVPGPYLADRLVMRWYQPFIDPESELNTQDFPPAFSPQRQKALVIIHGWLGWSKKTFRQRMRLFHNAKEDVLYGGPLLMGPTGLDLSFTFVTGNPRSDDIGVLLQCAPHPESTVALGQASLIEFLTHSGRGGCNISDSYNVGYLDWSQVAFNQSVENTEKSLWVPSHSHYVTDESLLTILKDITHELPSGTEITFLGHSLGAGLAIRLQNVFVKGIQDGTLSSSFSGSSLILADPYFSNFGFTPYDSGYWPGRRARHILSQTSDTIKALRQQKEWKNPTHEWSMQPHDYQGLLIVSTRDDQTELFGDENRPLKFDYLESLYIDLNVQSIQQGLRFSRSQFPRYTLLLHALDNMVHSFVSMYHRRHVYPLFWILDRMGRGLSPTQADVLRTTRATRGGGWYRQSEGSKTISTQDDEMSFQVHINN